MAEKYLKKSKIGGCRGNIGHIKQRATFTGCSSLLDHFVISSVVEKSPETSRLRSR